MNNSFIQEAFRQVYLTEDVEELSLDAVNPDNTESFLDMVNGAEDDETISDVYDLEAEAKEDLKQSYIGKVILDCNVCHSNVFFDKEEITQDEDGICCTDVECPYCMSNEGYTIIGEVKPYQEEEDVDIEDIETEEVPEEDEVDIEIEDEEPEEEEELEEGLKADEVKELRGNEEINGADGPIAAVDKLEGSDEIRGPKYKELNEKVMTESLVDTFLKYHDDANNANNPGFDKMYAILSKYGDETEPVDEIFLRAPEDEQKEMVSLITPSEKIEECGEPEIEEGLTGTVAGKVAGKAIGTAVGGPVGGAVGSFVGGKIGDKVQDTFSEGCEDKKELEEGIEDVSINTEDENITMTTKEDGGVVVETSPKEDEVEEFSGEEMIAPLEPETEVDVEDAIETNSEDEEEIPEEDELDFEEEPGGEEDFEEFDEESFDNLGESYLKRCYENVTSFKTSNITLNENKEFVIEGKIGFDSGNEKNTQFIFSPKTSENGKLKLEGYNKQISKGKKTFKLNCSVDNKSLVCESLNYNYKGKNDLNESVRVYGTVKRK